MTAPGKNNEFSVFLLKNSMAQFQLSSGALERRETREWHSRFNPKVCIHTRHRCHPKHRHGFSRITGNEWWLDKISHWGTRVLRCHDHDCSGTRRALEWNVRRLRKY